MNLSVCIITKNEKEKLMRALDGFAFRDVELVIIDTGSTDGTVEALREFAKRPKKAETVIGQYTWTEDFSAARNEAIRLAGRDWIFMLDSDEYLWGDWDEQAFKELLAQNTGKVGRVLRRNLIPGQEPIREWISRVFEKALYHYEGTIHEQIVAGNPQEANSLFATNLAIEHDGYCGTHEERTEKAARNEKMLLAEMERKGEDPYLLYQLGKSRYMQGDYTGAAEWFDRALYYDLDEKLEYVQDMVETYAYALINSDQAAKALGLEGVAEAFSSSADFCFALGLVEMQNERFLQAVDCFERAARLPSSKVEGVNSYLAFYNIGVIKECLGDKREALAMYRACGTYNKALLRIRILEGDGE